MRCKHELPKSPLSVDATLINPVQLVRDLGIFTDTNFVIWTHVQRVVSHCFAILRQLRSVHHSIPMSVFWTLIVSLLLLRLDNGNAVLVGLPVHLYCHLQSVTNAAAWFFYSLRFSDHISDALVSLHWLHWLERITFKVAVLMYKSIHGSPRQPTWVDWFMLLIYPDVVPSVPHVPVVCWFNLSDCLLLVAGSSHSQAHLSGTIGQIMWLQPRLVVIIYSYTGLEADKWRS